MNKHERDQIIEQTIKKIRSIALAKGDEYANVDALQNFRDAAALDQESMVKACWGMWKKHIVSIAEFVRRHDRGQYETLEKWDEKLIDNIIYSMLMQCILVDEMTSRGGCINQHELRFNYEPIIRCSYCGVSEGEYHKGGCPNHKLSPNHPG